MTVTSIDEFSLFSVAVRTGLLLLITLVVSWIIRKKSAAVVHRIWTLGILGCLLIPGLTSLTPSLTLTVPAALVLNATTREANEESAASPGVIPDAAPRPAILRLPPVDNSQQVATSTLNSNSSISRVIQVDATSEPKDRQLPMESTTPPSLSWPDTTNWSFLKWVAAVWAFGATLLGLRLTLQFVLIRRMVGQCTATESNACLEVTEVAIKKMGLARQVPILQHPDAGSPMVAGLRKPVVILPADADQWPAERRQMVLLHELAHVARRDLLTQTMAGIVCAVHWFNPLTWWAAHQMRKLRELACDDHVVTLAIPAGDYAEALLDVAKSYRCHQRNFVVPMARQNDIKSRIVAVLDSTRRRATLSRKSAAMTVIAALLLSVFVGGLQVTSRAAVPQEPPKSVQIEPEDHGEDRSMFVRVLDSKGQLLSKVSIRVSVWELDGANKFPNTTYTTDGNGGVKILLPHRIRILRLWPSKPGYVPQFVNFAQGTHKEGKLIPDEYTFHLATGHRLSGLIVDQDGQPIVGAKVHVNADVPEPVWGLAPKPMISTWLANGDDAATTDAEGAWEITNAPAEQEGDDFTFRLRVTHPDFVDDRRWGQSQEDQAVTTSQLRDGTAKLIMKAGVAIAGSITGPDGDPVTAGLVVWDDRPYRATGVNETQIQPTGRYESLRLPLGDYPVTVLAPGFAPEQQIITLSHDMQDVDFQLESGNALKCLVTDSSGKPVPNAFVRLGSWRGTEALYNNKHPNVPDSMIPRFADENGMYAWDWAPADGVEYTVSANGYDMQNVTLVPKQEPHQVVLTQPITITGRVVDAESGERINDFRVIPVKEFRQDFYSTDFQSGSVAFGKNGEYSITISSHGDRDDQHRVRIEADGYRTAFGRQSIGAGDPPLKANFKLEKVASQTAIVVDSNGRPVQNFTVAIGTPTTSPQFRLDHPDNSFGQAFQVDGKEHFQLAATFEPQRIRVFNNDGFAEILCQPNDSIGTIHLKPWASVSGRLTQNGHPISGQWIYFNPLVTRELTEARFQDSFSAKTDSSGNFHFSRLPPMSGSIRAHLGPWKDSLLTSSQSIAVDLKTGEHRELALGGDGAMLTGQVVATGRSNKELSKQWSINYLISRRPGSASPEGAKPLSFDARGPLKAAWMKQADFGVWRMSREHFFVKLSDDGRLQINGVRSGEYDLVVQLYEQPAGCLVETIGEKVIPVVVTESAAASGEMELGKIEVACRIGPRIGSDMRAFEFTDFGGRVRLVNDMKGRFVLFHVWASWCAPCLASMPEVKATTERYPNDPLMIVGLNVDEDKQAAQSMVQKNEWDWSHNFLGEDSTLMRQLAVSSVPAYYLIGPDGSLVGSSNSWKEIQALLTTKLP